MSWNAKPAGGYAFTSTEAKENMREIARTLIELGFTKQAIAGVLGNVYAESAFNPWRWQGDTYNVGGGYGLFQFTRGDDYTESYSPYYSVVSRLPHYSPNRSVTTTTSGATPKDGISQCYALSRDVLSKWVSWCWRVSPSGASYYDGYTEERNAGGDLWNLRSQLITFFGANNALTLDQFRLVTDVDMATLAFMAGYEGNAAVTRSALNNSFNYRQNYARQAYDIIKDMSSLPVWLIIKLKEVANNV